MTDALTEARLLVQQLTADLRASEQRLEALLSCLPDGLMVVSAAGRILLANPAAGRLFDRDCNDLRGYELGLPLPSGRACRVEIRSAVGGSRLAELLVGALTWEGRPAFVACVRAVDSSAEAQSPSRTGGRQAAESLRGLAARLQIAREQERELTSREIHDVSQLLAALDMRLSVVANQLREGAEPGAVIESLESASCLLASTQETSYRLLLQLRPMMVDDLGLAAAIEWHATEFSARTGLPVVWETNDGHPLSDPQARIAVFRLFQHALANIERHAQATKVRLTLRRRGGMLVLRVRDNGRGITRAEVTDGRSLGIVEMRETALQIGGRLRIAGSPGRGTTLALELPIEPPPRGQQGSGRATCGA